MTILDGQRRRVSADTLTTQPDAPGEVLMGPDLHHDSDGAIPKKQLTRDECAVRDPVDQCLEEASAADAGRE